jgi:hypothetical protein
VIYLFRRCTAGSTGWLLGQDSLTQPVSCKPFSCSAGPLNLAPPLVALKPPPPEPQHALGTLACSGFAPMPAPASPRAPYLMTVVKMPWWSVGTAATRKIGTFVDNPDASPAGTVTLPLEGPLPRTHPLDALGWNAKGIHRWHHWPSIRRATSL